MQPTDDSRLTVAMTKDGTVTHDERRDDGMRVEALLSSVEFAGSFALGTVRYRDIIKPLLNSVSTRTRGALVCGSFCLFRRRSSLDRSAQSAEEKL